MVSSLDYRPCPSRWASRIHHFKYSLGFYLSPECLLNFLSNFYISPCVAKIFQFMEFIPRKLIDSRHFYSCPSPLKKSPPCSCHHALGRSKLLIPPGSILFPPTAERGVENYKLLSQNSVQKIWGWLGTLGFLYFVWVAVFSNMMALQFCRWYLLYRTLLLLNCNYDNLILKLNQRNSYLDEG